MFNTSGGFVDWPVPGGGAKIMTANTNLFNETVSHLAGNMNCEKTWVSAFERAYRFLTITPETVVTEKNAQDT